MRSSTAKLTFVSLAFAAFTHGCGGSGGGGGGSPIAIANLAGEYAKAFCHRVYSCCDSVERAAESAWGATEADCVTAATGALSVANLQAGVNTGRIVYHGDRARSCIDNIAALSCADWGVGFVIQYVPDCPQVSEGTVAEGAACTNSGECASGYCAAGATSMSCLARAGIGESCSDPAACQSGLYCSLTSSTCTAIQSIGATCDENAACQNFNCPPPTGSAPRTCDPPSTCNGL